MQYNCFSYVVYVQRSRIAGFSCYNGTSLPKNCCSTSLFALFIKDSLKEDTEVGWIEGLGDWIGGLTGWLLVRGGSYCWGGL
jgi:hypothetical protein